MTEVAPTPNLGSEIEEHSFIERPRVFQALLMNGRMLCWGAAIACGPFAGAVVVACANACDPQAMRSTAQIKDFQESGVELRIEKCMTPDYSRWLIILQSALDRSEEHTSELQS